MRQVHATRILVMTTYDIIDSEINDACNGRAAPVSFYPNPPARRTGRGFADSYDSASARSECQSYLESNIAREVDRDLGALLKSAAGMVGPPWRGEGGAQR